MNHEDEVRHAIAVKLTIKTKKRVNGLFPNCDDPCECRENVKAALRVLVDLGRDVFHFRPEYHAAICILADGIRESVDELHKLEIPKRDKVIYL